MSTKYVPNMGLVKMPKDSRICLPFPGRIYYDLLKIDSAINSRSIPVQAQSLLCSKIQQREPMIKERVEYLARRHNLSFEQIWDAILSDKYKDLENLLIESDSES